MNKRWSLYNAILSTIIGLGVLIFASIDFISNRKENTTEAYIQLCSLFLSSSLIWVIVGIIGLYSLKNNRRWLLAKIFFVIIILSIMVLFVFSILTEEPVNSLFRLAWIYIISESFLCIGIYNWYKYLPRSDGQKAVR